MYKLIIPAGQPPTPFPEGEDGAFPSTQQVQDWADICYNSLVVDGYTPDPNAIVFWVRYTHPTFTPEYGIAKAIISSHFGGSEE
jgi:uncharacterized protein (UPF0297 family)